VGEFWLDLSSVFENQCIKGCAFNENLQIQVQQLSNDWSAYERYYMDSIGKRDEIRWHLRVIRKLQGIPAARWFESGPTLTKLRKDVLDSVKKALRDPNDNSDQYSNVDQDWIIEKRKQKELEIEAEIKRDKVTTRVNLLTQWRTILWTKATELSTKLATLYQNHFSKLQLVTLDTSSCPYCPMPWSYVNRFQFAWHKISPKSKGHFILNMPLLLSQYQSHYKKAEEFFASPDKFFKTHDLFKALLSLYYLALHYPEL